MKKPIRKRDFFEKLPTTTTAIFFLFFINDAKCHALLCIFFSSSVGKSMLILKLNRNTFAFCIDREN